MTDIAVPDPLVSLQQYLRFYHLDIVDSEDGKLLDEIYALRPLLWDLPGDHWLRERVGVLEAELAKRRGNNYREFQTRLKPKLAEGIKQ